ncbi:MAG: CoA-binding protein [Candidatus Bathyarchaeota archaeon]|nr:CoA-binding protein [Candidatus Bathyarchaeota archaeon]
MRRNEIREILTKYKTIVVVGLSRKHDKDSHIVSAYLKEHGFRIIPVNPFAAEVLGEKSYKSLLEIPPEIQKTIEVVEIFRPSQEVLLIVELSIKLKLKYGKLQVVWMQLGIVNEQAAEMAKKAGLTVIMNKCMMIEHKRFFG